MKKRFIAAAVLLTMSIGALAFGGRHCGHGGYDEHGGFHFMMEKYLDLSEDQKTQIEAITGGKNKKDMRKQRKQMFKEMMALNPEDPNYAEQLETMANEKSEAIKQKIMEHGERRARIYEILTPEQREKMAELMEKRMEKHAKWHDDDEE